MGDSDGQRVTLTKAQRSTAAGRELIDLLLELSEDGQVTRDETSRLRSWLEVERGVDLPACGFLYEVLDSISQDGEITEDELDRLALAMERVLPVDVRLIAAGRRKLRRDARRQMAAATRAAQRIESIEAKKGASTKKRERARPLRRIEFFVAGCRRREERRLACADLSVGDQVSLEREPDNPHDSNAILILKLDDSELGYVPREKAVVMAPLLDSGAQVMKASISKLYKARDGFLVPIITASLRPAPDQPRQSDGQDAKAHPRVAPAGCGAQAAWLVVLSLAIFAIRC